MRVPPLAQVHLVRDGDDLSQTLSLQMMALLHHPAYAAEACTASRVVSPQGEAFQMRQDRVHMVAKRPHLILVGAVALDARIQPQPKNACRLSSSPRSFSFNESAKEGLTSRPDRSFARMAKEMQKHPSPSARPVTYQGSSGWALP